jgi:hypothetical protein
MGSWKNFKHLVLEGGLSDIVLYLVGGWQVVLLIMMGAIFVFSSGLLFERMKEYQSLRRIAGIIAVFAFGTLCLEMVSKVFGNEKRHETAHEFTPSKDSQPEPNPVAVSIGTIEETEENAGNAKSGAK